MILLIKRYGFLILSMLFSLAAAVNLGFSGFLLGLPFFIYLIFYFSLNRSTGAPLRIFVGTFAICCVLLAILKKENSKIYFPIVGKTIVAFYDQPRLVHPKGSEFEIKSVSISHPDFGFNVEVHGLGARSPGNFSMRELTSGDYRYKDGSHVYADDIINPAFTFVSSVLWLDVFIKIMLLPVLFIAFLLLRKLA